MLRLTSGVTICDTRARASGGHFEHMFIYVIQR